jgi:hypothetical protein
VECLIVFLNFYLLCFCNSGPDLQLNLHGLSPTLHQEYSTRPKAVVSAAAVAGFISLLGLPHPIKAKKNSFANPMQISHHVLDT